MEGPSIYLAVEQLQPFMGQSIQIVEGNTKIGKERLDKEKILNIFSHGKVLMFQFKTFALRVHFLLYGSFEAIVDGKKATGDYPKKRHPPRLSIMLANGRIDMYNCSLRFVEEENARRLFDFSSDIMSPSWSAKKAYIKIKKLANEEIGDVLLDQTIFAGIGNIIKNEVLIRSGINPVTLIEKLTPEKIKALIALSHDYVFKFYQWRKAYALKKHYLIYRQSICKICGNHVKRIRTGKRQRFSYICAHCQPNLTSPD